jgi:galactofuranosylgalactofuranosylrhamnosyl-N-acetylglucosaminyl-diphospho-decaprenol beta-1,5/1,6-galactofuranosyltransferase
VVLEQVGLSLPLFLKWDDSEFGLRAKEAGFPTVSFPGAAVWHVPWTDKNDGLDWQSYFHQRNRFVAALLHSPYPRGGRMVRESLNHQIKHLVSMQYATVELRHRALEDVRDSLPAVRREKPAKHGKDDTEIPGRLALLITAGLAPIRQLRPVRSLSQEFPEAELPAMDASWYRLARFDSAVVSMNDGTSAALYRRDPERFRDLLRRTLEIHERFRREWPRLAAEYRAALPDITSPEAWQETFRPWTEAADE